MKPKIDINIILLHEGMVNKAGEPVTTSLTMIDTHDIARSARTFGATNFFVAHPSPALRKLARTLQSHWSDGFGASYNPDRKNALEVLRIVTDLDEAITHIEQRTGQLPILLGTSAKAGGARVTFGECRSVLHTSGQPGLLMLGTGWGMEPELLNRCDYFIEPIVGPTDYNHLSVRSACAIMLDRLAA